MFVHGIIRGLRVRYHSRLHATVSTKTPIVTLFTKPDCWLCDKALLVLSQSGWPYKLRKVNIDAPESKEWRARYWCDIPVFHLNGAYWAKHELRQEDVDLALSEATFGRFKAREGEPDMRGVADPS